jgi:hypothetical protein
MSEPIATQSPNSQQASSTAPIQQVRIDIGAATIAIVICLMLVIGACGVVMGLNLSRQQQLIQAFTYMERQEALKERRLMDMEAYALLNGWKRPGDDTFGPTGNVERMVPKHK